MREARVLTKLQKEDNKSGNWQLGLAGKFKGERWQSLRRELL